MRPPAACRFWAFALACALLCGSLWWQGGLVIPDIVVICLVSLTHVNAAGSITGGVACGIVEQLPASMSERFFRGIAERCLMLNLASSNEWQCSGSRRKPTDPVAREMACLDARTRCSNDPLRHTHRPHIRLVSNWAGLPKSFYGRWERALRTYASQHGHSVVVGTARDRTFDAYEASDFRRTAAWRRGLLVRRAFGGANVSRADWVMWMDADIVVTNSSIALDAFVDSHHHVVVADDPFGICSGSFFVRNSCTGRQFLRLYHAVAAGFRANEALHRVPNDALLENAAFMQALLLLEAQSRGIPWHDRRITECPLQYWQSPAKPTTTGHEVVTAMGRIHFGYDHYGFVECWEKQMRAVVGSAAKPRRSRVVLYNWASPAGGFNSGPDFAVPNVWKPGNFLNHFAGQPNRTAKMEPYVYQLLHDRLGGSGAAHGDHHDHSHRDHGSSGRE